MALYDVKDYYYKMQRQYLEMKSDLADYEQAFKEGHITEEQLEDIKLDISRLEDNYNRLTYILYLLEIPNRPKKQKKFFSTNKDLIYKFSKLKADTGSVVDENASVLEHIRAELKNLTDK